MSTTTKLSASYVVIGVKEKIGYGLGDFASNLSFGFVSLFLLFLYEYLWHQRGTSEPDLCDCPGD